MFCKEEDEKERQSSFLSLFMKVDRHFMTKCFGQMQELGIYPGQIPVLGLVSGRDGLSQREIAKILHIKPPTVNVSIQRLEKAGFLYKKPDEKDLLQKSPKQALFRLTEAFHHHGLIFMDPFQCFCLDFLSLFCHVDPCKYRKDPAGGSHRKASAGGHDRKEGTET